MTPPTIRIKNSWLLNNKVVPLLTPELAAAGHEEMASREYIDEKVKEYTAAWTPYSASILRAMCEVLGVEFRQNIIDAYIVPFGNSFSDPLVISPKYTPDRMIDVLTHELTHRLLTDNTRLGTAQEGKLADYWRQLFGNEHSFVTLVHIPVHAMLAYIFTDILQEPARLQRDKDACIRFEPYQAAWEYVDQHDYHTILSTLKEQYESFLA